MLTAEQLRALIHYDPETGLMNWRVATAQRIKVGDAVGSIHPHGYLKAQIYGVKYMQHRLAWLYVYGVWPSGEIDHMNGIRHDNRISNLRDVSRLVNSQGYKSRKPGTSGYRGVYWVKHTRSYMARINSCGKPIHLGMFATAEEARDAYLSAKNTFHAPINKDL